ncbi:hypothetical protein AB6A40_008693 [Gnathostoma spinigerum]|uniref:Helicase C-terminal domain-containing protein n=1 Tax=Gnathostoma spinigerum TaxID=75299 RepID=A0ABD6EUX3_9BILA
MQFLFRRTHHILNKLLPERSEYVLILRKSPIQRILYRAFVQYAQSEIHLSGTSVFNPLKAFAACTKIWNHPDILYETLKKKHKEAAEAGKMSANSGLMNQLESRQRSNAAAPTMANSSSSDCKKPPTLEQIVLSFCSKNGTSKVNTLDKNESHHVPPSSPLCGETFASNNHPYSASLSSDFNTVEHCRLNMNPCCSSATSDQLPYTKARLDTKKVKVTAESTFEELDNGLKYDWAEVTMRHYVPGIVENGCKMAVAISLIKASTSVGDKMLLFSQSVMTLDLIEWYLENKSKLVLPRAVVNWKKQENYIRFDGSTPATERERLITRFNEDPNVMLFLITTRAGSLGINLTSANRVIIFDASWNPCHDAQAVCRIYRYGQTKPTYIYRLIVDNCMERAIFNRQIAKNGLQLRVVDDQQIDANVTTKEMEQLLVYDEALDVSSSSLDVSSWNLKDCVLWIAVHENRNFFVEEPLPHESLILEREEGLSEAEKVEAKMLYDREKQLYNGEMNVTDFSSGHYANVLSLSNEQYRSRQTWPILPFSHDPPPLRSTPFPMEIEKERDKGNLFQAITATSGQHPMVMAIKPDKT